MKKKLGKSLICVVAIVCMLLGNVVSVGAIETFETIGNVTPSNVAYKVDLVKGYNNFLSNEKPVELVPGKRYYMTYTVKEMSENTLTQNGVVLTQDKDLKYPYGQGMMKYRSQSDLLFEAGYTYFYRVEVTEEGFDYVVAKGSKDSSSWIEFPAVHIAKTDGCKYFGVWMAGSGTQCITATLTRVLCYDEAGNDLGISIGGAGSASAYRTNVFDVKEADHYYEFSLKDAPFVVISNDRPTDAKVVYMSYKTENVTQNTATKAGIVYTKNASLNEPHGGGNGVLNFNSCKGSPLVSEGAEYLIRIEVVGESIETIVRKTVGGKEELFSFSAYYGNYNKEAKYFSWWFGDNSNALLTADFKEFRIYDEQGNNLGVRLNDHHKNVPITHYGNLEDYTYCEGVYYCKKNDTLLILDDECNAGVLVDEEGQKTQWGSYVVRDTTLTLTLGEQEQKFNYFYKHMSDEEGNRYLRLGKKTVEFVTGQEGSSGNQVVEVTAESKYKVAEPEVPNVEGHTFDAWCLRDGTEYNFEDIVTESLTLYARYTDGNGQKYLLVNAQEDHTAFARKAIVTGVSGILVAATVLGIVLIVKKGRKNYVG